MKLEADGLSTSMVASPPGTSERFALVMDNEQADLRIYFFITREMVHDLVQDLCEMVGYDA